jgi:hypothetical protein
VALGRERDAAIIFMGDLWLRVETCEAAAEDPIKASGHVRPHRKAGHMTASDQCSSRK